MIERYADSVDPINTDGRDIDPSLGQLIGEGAHQISRGSAEEHVAEVSKVWQRLPEPRDGDPTYYDVPLLQKSVWTWAIPLYYFVGGVSGASLALGAAARLVAGKQMAPFARRCSAIGFVGTGISGALLVYDLGRPSRFLNMLRVFRPTSPMNVGAWILSGAAGGSFAAVLFGWPILELAAGVFGLGLATYTGVLVANTAVPVWQASRRLLPAVFGSSAVGAAGAVWSIFSRDERSLAIASKFALAGQTAELITATVMERQASSVARVGRPFRRGVSAVLWRTAEVLTLSALILSVRGKPRVAAGVCGALGSLMLRFAVEEAGNASASDARASFHQQRSTSPDTNS